MISIVFSYYRQPDALEWMLERLEDLSNLDFEVVAVDDGSNDGVLRDRMERSPLSGKTVTIKKDIPWNLPGARNWGMVFAQGLNCLRTDIDHRPTPDTLKKLIEFPPLEGEAFRFRRVDQIGKEIHSHGDTFFLSKDNYWEVGGYDENLSGFYGQNSRDFSERFAEHFRILPCELIMETNEAFRSDAGSRSLTRNWAALHIAKLKKNRAILRLSNAVEVSHF